jgi:threonine dehydratase
MSSASPPMTLVIPPTRSVVRPTTWIEAPRLERRLGLRVVLASETFQHTGSFKFRAAYNVASQVPERHIITASSGNFGQALAHACSRLHKSCAVVMPHTSAAVKVAAVREYGGIVDLVDVTRKSRAERVAELAAERPDAYVASAYDDPLVIAGNATLGEEVAARAGAFEVVVAPVGGGGLTAGLVTGIAASGQGSRLHVVGAEPLLGNDAARSLRAGAIVRNEREPATIADGARTVSLGHHNWQVLSRGLREIVEVPEEAIREAVRLLFGLANLKVEPTGALAVAALLAAPERFAGQSVCCVLSGGNVDPAVYREILAEA